MGRRVHLHNPDFLDFSFWSDQISFSSFLLLSLTSLRRSGQGRRLHGKESSSSRERFVSWVNSVQRQFLPYGPSFLVSVLNGWDIMPLVFHRLDR